MTSTPAPEPTAHPRSGSGAAPWWQDAKFGLFVHWGPYSQAGVEASWPIMVPGSGTGEQAISQADYEALATTFDPAQFDAADLVELARSAGQRYIVFTSKHHDGFCMFDSSYTDYKITNTPFGRDICRELADAAATAGMPLGWYHSQPDLHHTGFRDTSRPASENWGGEPTRPEWFGYLAYLRAQLTELLTLYGDIFMVWFDGLHRQEKYDPHQLNRWLSTTWPGLMINDRNGGNHSMSGMPGTAGKLLPEWAWGDYTTPEQEVPDHLIPQRPWETCMTINDTWAYNPNDQNYKSATKLITTLVEVVSKGGNFLLNVGPRPDGTIQPEFVERLAAIGAWMRRHGESIYGTRVNELPRQDWGYSTATDGVVYLQVTAWSGAGADQVVVDGLPGALHQVTLLGSSAPVEVSRDGAQTTVTVPVAAQNEHVTVIKIRHG